MQAMFPAFSWKIRGDGKKSDGVPVISRATYSVLSEDEVNGEISGEHSYPGISGYRSKVKDYIKRHFIFKRNIKITS